MRTVIRIDDELYRSIRERAAATGRSADELIEDALRRSLQAEPDPGSLEPLPTYGGTGIAPGVDLSSNAALEERMAAGSAVRPRN